MVGYQRGKAFVIFLFILCLDLPSGFRVLADSNALPTEQEYEYEIREPKHEKQMGSSSLLDRQENQLEMLENLVKTLSEAVARLESRLPDCRKVGSVENERHRIEESRFDIEDKNPEVKKIVEGNYGEVDDKGFVGKAGEVERRSGVSVTKYYPSWSDRFQFLSAVKLEYEATAINVLPEFDGFSNKYVAIGDERGRVFIFVPSGDVLVEFDTLSDSPITSMLSYLSLQKNESVLVTGHKNGVILAHRIWEASNGEEWHSLSMANLRAFESVRNEEEGLRITILEVHQVGRMRYILSSDFSGKIVVFRENGTVFGSVKSASPPLVFLKQRLLFLTETGAGSLDLRSMKIKESECEGMNGSLARNYVFDALERSKAYGLTSKGDLIHVVLLGDMVNLKCRVRSKRKIEMDWPLAVQAIKGYLLVVSREKVFVYNVSSQHYIRAGGPRPVFFASLDEIRSSFLSLDMMNDDSMIRKMVPLIASDHEKLVVLGLGSGYVGVYRSNLPLFKAEFNTMLWTSPVLLFILFLFGAWHLFGKKKESLTSWGPDDPFATTSTVSAGASLGAGLEDRTFADSSSRTNDIMELRGGGLRGPSRRYESPSPYPGSAPVPYRQSTADPNYKAGSSDPSFRTAGELKYRGPNLETTGFPKRRDVLFSNTQVVEDSIN
ncbi:uncharacterized membrane protein At1g75140-like [Macadamia integrifolia]|uniref:uncharacterized membrane protein At1g75140-like n=1 Tax=Macadamia integrifolia TaxID=60698 RepID=UPI001C4E6952|nr:uncharacterized membrane protein At1g75140-like [Macadamia integrifolia]